MLKAVVISENDEQKFEKEIETLINGKALWHKDFKKLISISYSYNRDSDMYEEIVHSALIVYESEE